MAEPTTVVLVDDHPLFSRGLELLLHAASRDIRVVGRTDDAAMAVALVHRCRPHAAIVDLAMPPPGGHDAIRAIKRAHPDTRVLALSGLEDPDDAVTALHAGADGFLHKTARPDELLAPLQALVDGAAVLAPDVLGRILALTRGRRDGAPADLDDGERRLWRLVAEGTDTAAMARELLVSERTAKRMVAALMRRIGAQNRVHAAALAGRAGVLDERPGDHRWRP